MYDESIELCDDDDDDEYELLAGRRRPGVSPVRRPPFQQQHNQHQRPSRAFQRGSSRHQLHRSESESLSLGMMSGEDEGSPGPQGEEQQHHKREGKKMSSKDFTPQSSQEGGKHENLISMASSYAKKLMSSGSEKAKERPPPDVAEGTRREQKVPPEPRKPPPPQQQGAPAQPQSTSAQQHAPPPQQSRTRSEDDEDDDDDDDDEYDDMNMAQIEGVYNPQDYEHLNVTPEIKELFHCITRYEPPMIGTQMDVKLRPFIPEYYPSVGDIDAFIKVLHPEVQDDHLGIKYLDEPSPFQSDPSVLDLRLRALAKQSSTKSVTVKKIDNVGKNAKIIENWIKDISDLHRSKPSPSVHYSKPMPDIDSLIQEWPAQVEDLLKTISLPSSELDCDLSTYVDIVCNLLDIPVYKSRIQSLHVLFTLYATYKHFNHYGPLGMGSAGGGSDGRTDLDHLLPSATSMRMEDNNNEVDRLQIS